MIILGIDPGSHVTGYAFLDKQKSNIKVLEYGAIKAKPTDKVFSRLGYIHKTLSKLCNNYNPDILVMEASFVGQNPKTALVLGHARGAIMTLCNTYNMNFAEYSPKEVKLCITGNGSSNKSIVAIMVQRLLGLKDLPEPEDASDALAVGLTYCNSNQNIN